MESISLAISPLVGVGQMRFGQSRRAIHSLLGRPSEMFRRSAWSGHLTDSYDELRLTLDYTDETGLDFIEIGSGRCTVTVEDVQLLPGRAVDVADRLRTSGFTTRPFDTGLSIVGAGVNLFIPSTENDAAVEGVSATAGPSVSWRSPFSVSPETRRSKRGRLPPIAG